ncbi:alpha/beta hydrolase [Gordonia caeni]|uniref:Alpha/beta hydrolase n=1 Tax=Gordonia caeni TaxID=1007097 RepID=A0ABP7NVT6_9ACTN
MRTGALNPELRRAYRFMPAPPIARRWQRGLLRRATGLLPGPRTPAAMTYRRVDLRPGVAAHVYAPAGAEAKRGALLWIHGGGMVIGTAAQDHRRCFGVARALGIVVVSADYRLAPEHPYPAPLDDCHAVWSWMLAAADECGIDPARTAVGGQSAGGGLAAGLVQRLHDEGGLQPVAQWLFCPMLDDRTAADRTLDRARHAVWNNRANRVGWTGYLGAEPGGEAPEYAAPARRTDLAGLPPAWIGAGDAELFFDEDRRYARALAAAGVPTEFDVVPGGPHAFESFAAGAPVSREYRARAQRWLGDRLTAAGPDASPR